VAEVLLEAASGGALALEIWPDSRETASSRVRARLLLYVPSVANAATVTKGRVRKLGAARPSLRACAGLALLHQLHLALACAELCGLGAGRDLFLRECERLADLFSRSAREWRKEIGRVAFRAPSPEKLRA
jgi:hypothetical protein